MPWHSLKAEGHVFACGCTRREAGPGALPRYLPQRPATGPFTARACGCASTPGERVLCRSPARSASSVSLAATSGDFIVRRADGLTAYHLAVVVDDAAAGGDRGRTRRWT